MVKVFVDETVLAKIQKYNIAHPKLTLSILAT